MKTIYLPLNETSTHQDLPWENSGLPRCKNLWHFFFVFLARAGVCLLFNSLLALLFSLFNIIREFDKFLHRGWAESSEPQPHSHSLKGQVAKKRENYYSVNVLYSSSNVLANMLLNIGRFSFCVGVSKLFSTVHISGVREMALTWNKWKGREREKERKLAKY